MSYPCVSAKGPHSLSLCSEFTIWLVTISLLFANFIFMENSNCLMKRVTSQESSILLDMKKNQLVAANGALSYGLLLLLLSLFSKPIYTG